MVLTRNYQSTDYESVREILEVGGLFWEASDNKESLERKIQRQPGSILVATEDKKVVGTQFIVEDFMPLLFRLAIHPDFRRRGIGLQLITHAEDLLRSKGHNHVNILVASNDLELIEHYQKQGYEKGSTYLWMVKEL
ncbi:MAG TPA: GNAT family N-acetyltransferase [Candidatus Nanoarchaeia archaeon]|nr:GNAT family N-acetyltransferase [Candidatus Nanoarchaeia archaeon]